MTRPDIEAMRIVSGAEWRRRAEKAEEEVRLLTTLFDRRCAHIGELEAALEPFKAWYGRLPAFLSTPTWETVNLSRDGYSATYADLRRAAELVGKL